MKHAAELGGDPRAVIADDCEHIASRLGDRAQRFAGKTMLVTGAAGMLPSYLVDTIAHLNDRKQLAKPARVIAVVRSPESNDGRLAHLAGRKDVRFIIADAAKPFEVDERVDFYVHAASGASPRKYSADPVAELAVSSIGTKHVLDLAKRDGAESVLFFSTSEVYGTPEAANIPTPETYIGRTSWLSRRDCYAEGKRFGEALCMAAFERDAAPVKIARPFHIQGPGLRLDDGRIVAELIRIGLAGEPFQLLSDGKATRTYGYIGDATVAFLQLLLSNENGQVFNIGADEPETSMLELARIVARLFDRGDDVRVNPNAPPAHLAGAPQRVRPDLTKMRERLGVTPEISLETGLARTIQWHRARMGMAVAR